MTTRTCYLYVSRITPLEYDFIIEGEGIASIAKYDRLFDIEIIFVEGVGYVVL